MTLKEYLISLDKNEKEAVGLILSSKVKVNDEFVLLPSYLVKQNDIIEIVNVKEYVSRGAYKLLQAIEDFKLDFKDKIVLDIGSSTGGFSQVALINGAKKVYALDSGTNQLDYKLRILDNVVVYENTNLKNINPKMFEEQLDICVCDVSFISLKEVFKVLQSVLKKNKSLMALIKPQFEAPKNLVEKGGYVNVKYHEEIINKVINFAHDYEFELVQFFPSKTPGKKAKNIEYISLFRKA
ncbi:TlyA family RNA methyltransferase [Mycoplasmopsis pulmonis]|uniref:TlyA family RNA methyltransferase n=1 Tax=Mycoplasmopsis pulmonis TaxID=2107 RepID=UPI001004F9B3|nr:TlyA family RNA methyltransferase [Mycoplasmopsis pulmonis]MDZ7293138.1 TlyA family RNA methyltransferase [Mycoplasmopsis pulmonis]VEU67935.1 hemolysin A [Mycoplasmopsis pulmonis]